MYQMKKMQQKKKNCDGPVNLVSFVWRGSLGDLATNHSLNVIKQFKKKLLMGVPFQGFFSQAFLRGMGKMTAQELPARAGRELHSLVGPLPPPATSAEQGAQAGAQLPPRALSSANLCLPDSHLMESTLMESMCHSVERGMSPFVTQASRRIYSTRCEHQLAADR